MTIQVQDLKTDNASLLQRWIEAKNSEAERMNDLFAAETKKVKQSPPPDPAAAGKKESEKV